MLIRRLALALLLVALGADAANADSTPTEAPISDDWSVEEWGGNDEVAGVEVKETKVDEAADESTAKDQGQQESVNRAPRVCTAFGRQVPCQTAHGVWSQLVTGWCLPAQDPPPQSDSIWQGRTDGAIYQCVSPGGNLDPNPNERFFRWLPTPPDAISYEEAESAARTATARLRLDAIDLGIQPRGDTTKRMSYVGWSMWFWADQPAERQFGTVTSSDSANGIAVSLSATAGEVLWDMGNGDTISCGKGRPWTLSGTQGRNVESPDCGYVYEQEGVYTATARTDWIVDWSAAGYSGQIPIQLRRSAEVIIGELQSVLVVGDG